MPGIAFKMTSRGARYFSSSGSFRWPRFALTATWAHDSHTTMREIKSITVVLQRRFLFFFLHFNLFSSGMKWLFLYILFVVHCEKIAASDPSLVICISRWTITLCRPGCRKTSQSTLMTKPTVATALLHFRYSPACAPSDDSSVLWVLMPCVASDGVA